MLFFERKLREKLENLFFFISSKTPSRNNMKYEITTMANNEATQEH